MGYFFEDEPKPQRRVTTRLAPPIPDTGWVTPREFPNIAHADVVGFDTETFDPTLLTEGPGWSRGKSHIVGVSLAVPGAQWYFPMRHEVEAEHNLNPATVLRFADEVLSNPRSTKVGTNLPYDIGNLQAEGVKVRGPLVDIANNEALFSDDGETNLEHMAGKWLGYGKESSTLYEWLAKAYGGTADGSQRANIFRAPPRLVGPYGEQDAAQPLLIARAQYPKLAADGLLPTAELENGLIPLIVAMRFAGVTINPHKVNALRELLAKEQADAERDLFAVNGKAFNPGSPVELARFVKSHTSGLFIPSTPTGQPSITKDWIAANNHVPLVKRVGEWRTFNKLRTTFVQGYLTDAVVNGKLHCVLNLLRGDDSGARSGRLSSSDPNMQNLPIRAGKVAASIRSCFEPDYGHKQWRKKDYSQIQYRALASYAVGPGAEELRESYRQNPLIDYHDKVLEKVARVAHWDVSTPELAKEKRYPLKRVNFGLVFGMGEKKLIRELSLNDDDGKAFLIDYHNAISYAKPTLKHYANIAQTTGRIRTLGGRLRYFDLWEPAGFGNYDEALPLHLAIKRYGMNIQRAGTHKGVNAELQGTEADVVKHGMKACWDSGVYDYVGVPRLMVHDELGDSDPGLPGSDEAHAFIKRTLETALPLPHGVPLIVNEEVGPNWGDTH